MAASASTASSEHGLPPAPARARTGGPARLAIWSVVALDIAILSAGGVLAAAHLADVGAEILAWAIAAAVVGLAAIQTPAGPQLGMDMPILLAAGFALGPIPAGLVAIAGYVDVREFRGEIGAERALFNRAQTSLSVMAASAVFAQLGASANLSPQSALAALAAITADSLVNYCLIAGVMALHERLPPRATLARLRLGNVGGFAATYACFGLVSILLAEVVHEVGAWGLLLFATPLVLGRQALSIAQRLEGAEHRLRIQGVALQQTSDWVSDERRDERLSIAADLHDDLLPRLFRVHLLGQVLRQELASGQLLAMEDDLPPLIQATNDATETVQNEIRSLRSSGLGMHGLSDSLGLLVRQLEIETPMTFLTDIDELQAAPRIELLAYQVAREALRNVVRHAGASTICISLARDPEGIRLTIEDDGRGFQPGLVDESQHFGIALMRERVELAGGTFGILSSHSRGTLLTVRLPIASPIET